MTIIKVPDRIDAPDSISGTWEPAGFTPGGLTCDHAPMPDAPGSPVPRVRRFDYLKSNFYRVVHVDGVVGGVAPGGNLVISMFNERTPIPQQVEHAAQINAESNTATMGEEILEHRVSRDAIVREVEVGLVLDYRAAASLHAWLGGQLEKMKAIEALKRNAAL